MNVVNVVGVIDDDYTNETDIIIGKERLYKTFIKTKRDSGIYDVIPIVCNELIPLLKGRVHVKGKFSSYNKHYENKNKLLLFIYVDDIQFTDDSDDENIIRLDGHVCKNVNIRKTPGGRTISDIHIAVNTYNYHSDYIPCICWGKDARTVSDLDVGKDIKVVGRIQSRKYQKIICERLTDLVAYEVSVSSIL